jgi:hypothetical protein
MIANICILLVILIIKTFGGLASLVFRRDPIEHTEIQSHFFLQSYNLAKVMADISGLSDQLFGHKPLTAFLRIIGFLFISFILALCWYAYQITHFDLLIRFFTHGLTVGLDQNELDYLLLHWPWIVFEDGRNSNTELYIGRTFVQAISLCSAILITLAVTSSLSILNTLLVLRRIGSARVPFVAVLARLSSAFAVSLLTDVLFVVLLFVIITAGGRLIGLSFGEEFKASTANNSLEYGFSISSGTPQAGSANIGIGYIVPDVNFDELARGDGSSPAWLRWLFPSSGFEGDAAALCYKYNIRPTCRDRLRALFLRRFMAMDHSLSDVSLILHNTYANITSFACGRNIWSTLAMGKAATEGLALSLPLFAALAAVFLSKLLVIPILIAITILDYVLVKLGRYMALSSERGFSTVLRHGATLLTTPPIIAIALLAALARWVC